MRRPRKNSPRVARETTMQQPGIGRALAKRRGETSTHRKLPSGSRAGVVLERDPSPATPQPQLQAADEGERQAAELRAGYRRMYDESNALRAPFDRLTFKTLSR
jgi:hypothetical protein